MKHFFLPVNKFQNLAPHPKFCSMSSVQVVMAASDPQGLFFFCLLDTVHCSKSY